MAAAQVESSGLREPRGRGTTTADTEDVTIVVCAGRAGRYTDWQITSELVRPWQQQALCGGVDSGLFFTSERERAPARHHREQIAKAICAACPVRQPCAVYALVNRELHGVWGGLSEADRLRLLTDP